MQIWKTAQNGWMPNLISVFPECQDHLGLNAPIATKVLCFSRLLKCLRSLYGKQEQSVLGHAVRFYTVKSQLSERRLSETTGLFEDNGRSRLFSLLSIAIKLPVIRISIIRKIQFFEVIRRSRLKKMLLNHPSIFEVQMSRMVIIISLFGRVRFTHLSDLEKKVETGNWGQLTPD